MLLCSFSNFDRLQYVVDILLIYIVYIMYYYNIKVLYVAGLCKLSSPEVKLLEGGKPLNHCFNVLILNVTLCYRIHCTQMLHIKKLSHQLLLSLQCESTAMPCSILPQKINQFYDNFLVQEILYVPIHRYYKQLEMFKRSKWVV